MSSLEKKGEILEALLKALDLVDSYFALAKTQNETLELQHFFSIEVSHRGYFAYSSKCNR